MSRTEDKMIEDLRDGRVAIAEIDEKQLEQTLSIRNFEQPSTFQSNTNTEIEPKATPQPKANLKHLENLGINIYDSIDTLTEKEEEIVEETKTQEKVIEKTQDIVETDNQTIKQNSFAKNTQIELETNQENEIDDQTNSIQLQKKKKLKFRVKFISIAICIAIGLFSGLAIHNAVRINSLNEQISTTSSEVRVNYAKYIYKISQVDDLIENGESAPTDNFEIPIEKHLQSYPEEMTDISEISQSSNWFDRLINKIRSFFGA